MSDAYNQKVCSKCAKIKDHSQFYQNRRLKDGFQSYCIECQKQYERDKRAEKKKVTRVT